MDGGVNNSMIAAKTHPMWTNLIRGTAEYQFKMAAASMLVFNLRSQLKKDPSKLDALIEEARRFFGRYEGILGDDLKRLFG